jgi:CDP-6-deoxy-D-xylo-4-hexulose-3-dehydrase
MEAARSEKTRAVIIAHTLGNPFDVSGVVRFCQAHGLWLIEDCCDAVGSRYGGRMVGTFGDISTFSFYPAHHMTMGEGGCLLTDSTQLKGVIQSYRDWGRDCWCETGADDTCNHRFDRQFGRLPAGYDHKFVFSHVGYNLKVTDMQAAVGLAQLEKLPQFIDARKRNYRRLREGLQALDAVLVLPEPTPHSDPCWFGFPMSVRPDAPFTRNQLVEFLVSRRIGTRLLFAGNLTKQPAYEGALYRVSGDLDQTDRIMNSTFWIGVYPGLSEAMLDYVVAQIHDYVGRRKGFKG